MTCRKRMDDVETGGKLLTREQSGGWPDYCPDGIRHEGGVTLRQAFAWNVGTCRSDVKGDCVKKTRQRHAVTRDEGGPFGAVL
jgi:hypothetical protein